MTDIGLQISETFRDLKIEQQLAPTREALSSAFNTGSANFLKAVDGIKGRWPVQRSSSSNSTQTHSSASTETPVSEGAKNITDSTITDSPVAATPITPTSPPRPPSVIAAQVTSDAKAALGAWGTGIGSFFTSKASRFSMSRSNSSSTSIPTPTSKDIPTLQSTEGKADPPTPAVANLNSQTMVTGDHKGAQGV